METITTTQVLELVKSTPDDKFGILVSHNTVTDKYCAFGLIRNYFNGDAYENSKATDDFLERTMNFLKETGLQGNSLIAVNDTKSSLFPEDTPKERVVHLLKDMIKAGF